MGFLEKCGSKSGNEAVKSTIGALMIPEGPRIQIMGI